MDLIANCKYCFYDWSCYAVTAFESTCVQLEVTASLLNNLHYNKEKNKIFKGYSWLCIAAKVSSHYSALYMELFGRSQSI